ncbi:hypothetical protein E3N88_15591 [Mikania micrantha]|uniref:Uncharacterized protein n=1 Tax=Mikania micrantha TaxID=192012 RepID=A0A5N6NXN4_9ASTR|nr:hypothetical protein E3N88_15591 [Mikania micrantha]
MDNRICSGGMPRLQAVSNEAPISFPISNNPFKLTMATPTLPSEILNSFIQVISQHNQTARPQNRPSRTTKWHDGRTSGIKVNLPDTNKGKGEETFNENQVFGPKGKRQAPRQKVM